MSTSSPGTPALDHLRARHRAGGMVNFVGGPADSITEGEGASTRSAGWWNRFAQHVVEGLGQPGGGGVGSVPVTTVGTWSIWSASGPPPLESGMGLGMYGSLLFPGSVLTTTQPCDQLVVLYSRRLDMQDRTGGRLSVRLDGEEVAVLDCGGADESGLWWDSGPLGPVRPRTVELACAGGAFALVDHTYFHQGDGATGPRFWRNAQRMCSATTEMFGFAAPDVVWAAPFTRSAVATNVFNGKEIMGGGSIRPDCVLCCTGTNDVAKFSNDRSRLYDAYVRIIDLVRDRCDVDPSIGLIVPTASVRAGGRYEVLQSASEAACATQGAFVIDLFEDLGTHADDRDGYYLDGVHPNDAGHAAWARHVAEWVLAGLGHG